MIGVQSIIVSNGLTGVNAASLLAANGVSALTVRVGALAVASKALPLVALAGGFAFLTNAIIKAINKQKEFNKLLEEGSSADIQSKIEETTKLIDDLEAKIAKITEGQKGFQLISGAEGEEASLKKLKDDLKKLKDSLKTTEAKELADSFIKTKSALQQTNIQLKESVERSKLLTNEEKEKFDISKQRQEFIEKFGEAEADKLIKIIQQNNALKKQEDQIKKNQEATKELKEKFMEIGKGIEEGIVTNLTDAVMGTKTLAQAAVSVLNDLKRKLVEVAIQRAVSGIGNFIGGILGGGGRSISQTLTGNKASTFLNNMPQIDFTKRANGGPVSAGGAFVVGEKGPELLQMGSRGGNIIPNNQLGGGTTNIVNVSVDASGSSVQGSQAEGQALGQLIAGVVQSTLIEESRAGGLLNR